MYTKHAGGEFVMGWGPLQQATFVAAKIHQGDSIDDVSRTYGIPRGKVVLFQAAIDLYRMCRLAKVGSEARKLLNNPDDFPYSTIFERLIEPTASRAALGFTVTEEGLFAPPAAEILPVLSRILEDAAAPESSPDKIDTRKLSTEAQQLLYIKKLGYRPSATGKTTAEQMEAQHGKKASSTDQQPDPDKNSRKTTAKAAKPSGRLLPKDLVCEVDQDKLVALVGEGTVWH